MHVEHAKAHEVLWLRHAAGIGEQIDNWRVCWIDGWDKCRILFVEIVESFGDPEQISLRHSRVTLSSVPT
jgi:hypothetical protein